LSLECESDLIEETKFKITS